MHHNVSLCFGVLQHFFWVSPYFGVHYTVSFCTSVLPLFFTCLVLLGNVSFLDFIMFWNHYDVFFCVCDVVRVFVSCMCNFVCVSSSVVCDGLNPGVRS